MKLSYIIPIYNVEAYLRECVDSIFSQSFDDYEIILVDDASPDSCPQICDEYAAKYPDIVKVIHQQNKGLAGARNSGFKKAGGDYVCFFDSDDFFAEDGIAEIYEQAVKADADILQNSFLKYSDGEENHETVKSAFDVGKVYENEQIKRKVCFSTTERSAIFVWRNLYKRSFLERNKILFDENLRMIEDSPFDTLAFLKAERLIAVDKPIYAYRIREDSLQRKKYIENYDKIMNYQWALKLKYYRENSDNDHAFYEDIADFTIKTNLPVLLANVYRNSVDGKFSLLKRIGESDMIRRSFKDYDINKFKSKSLDWWMIWFVKKRMYIPAHIICKKVLYK